MDATHYLTQPVTDTYLKENSGIFQPGYSYSHNVLSMSLVHATFSLITSVVKKIVKTAYTVGSKSLQPH